MATSTEVNVGLYNLSLNITNIRQSLQRAKEQMTKAVNNINALSTNYNDIITTINGYTPTGAFEQVTQDELGKITTEYQALKADAEAAVAALAPLTEF
jgi:hypothetical protein